MSSWKELCDWPLPHKRTQGGHRASPAGKVTADAVVEETVVPQRACSGVQGRPKNHWAIITNGHGGNQMTTAVMIFLAETTKHLRVSCHGAVLAAAGEATRWALAPPRWTWPQDGREASPRGRGRGKVAWLVALNEARPVTVDKAARRPRIPLRWTRQRDPQLQTRSRSRRREQGRGMIARPAAVDKVAGWPGVEGAPNEAAERRQGRHG